MGTMAKTLGLALLCLFFIQGGYAASLNGTIESNKTTEVDVEETTEVDEDLESIDINRCKSIDCEKFTKHFEVRNPGCSPIYGDSCCPIAFNCSIHKPQKDHEPIEFNKGYCFAEGVKHFPGDKLKTSNPCKTNCFCSSSGLFECPIIDCPSVFFRPKPDQFCMEVDEIDRCCGKLVCGLRAFQIQNKNKCEYDGKKYRFGQSFYPNDCTTCICNNDWDGNIKNPKSCRSHKKCSFELDRSRIEGGCEPIYHENTCCPIDFACPDSFRSIEVAHNVPLCLQDLDTGDGNETIESYFYDKSSGRCQQFVYEGNGGNDNRFDSAEECIEKCDHKINICKTKPIVSQCTKEEKTYFYDESSGECEMYNSDQCGTNDNNFKSLEDCEARCRQPDEPMNCKFDGKEFEKGDVINFDPVYPKRCLEVKCLTPPFLTFVNRGCPKPPSDMICHTDYSDPDACCPKYNCVPKKVETTETVDSCVGAPPCPGPPTPEEGFICVSYKLDKDCCPRYDCKQRKQPYNPCSDIQCGGEKYCLRKVDECFIEPCTEFSPYCVPKRLGPCDLHHCGDGEKCFFETIPCEFDECPNRMRCERCENSTCPPEQFPEPGYQCKSTKRPGDCCRTYDCTFEIPCPAPPTENIENCKELIEPGKRCPSYECENPDMNEKPPVADDDIKEEFSDDDAP